MPAEPSRTRLNWLLVAHRGASAAAPENTLTAFDLAKNHGADAVECDVRLSKDGTPVVFHDESLRRLAGVDTALAELTVADLRAVTIDGSVIPTLAEALVWSANGLPLIVEIKSGTDPERIVTAVTTTMQDNPMARVWTISSFDEAILTAIAMRSPGTDRALISAGPLDDAIDRAGVLGISNIHSHWPSLLTSTWPDGVSVCAWTVDDPSIAQTLIRRGVAGIMSNDPAGLAPLRRERKC